jgi:hypothetical protein
MEVHTKYIANNSRPSLLSEAWLKRGAVPPARTPAFAGRERVTRYS